MTAPASDFHALHAALEPLSLAIDELHPSERNPRRGDVDAIAESLTINGQYRPVVARLDGEILAGNHTWLAARQLGWSHIAALRIDVDDEQAARIMLADNRTAELGSYDDEALIDLLRSLDELVGTGFEDADLAALLAVDEGDDDSAPVLDVASLSVLVECRDEEQQRELIDRFEAEGLICRPLMM